MVDISTGSITSLTSSESLDTFISFGITQLWIVLFTDVWCSQSLKVSSLTIISVL